MAQSVAAISWIGGSNVLTSNIAMVLAVLFIWSIESSIDEIRSWMSGAVERRDEGATHRYQHFAGDVVGFGLAVENLLAVLFDGVAALPQSLQGFGAGEHNGSVPANGSKNRSSRGINA